MFSQPIKLAKDLYYFKEKHKIPSPTEHALMLGGLLAEMGHVPIFEALFGRMHIDLYTPTLNPNLFFEAYGERHPSQYKADGNRDGYIVRNGYSVHRIQNSVLEKLPEALKMKFYINGVSLFEKQLRTWYAEGIPNYCKTQPKEKEDKQSDFTELEKDIEDWFG